MTTLNSQLRGVSALLDVNSRDPIPLYRQIYQSYRSRILKRHLRAGQLVPSSRELAKQLRISRLPVLNAYAQLHAEGYFETRVGSGTFVAALPMATDSARAIAPAARRSGERLVSARAAALPPYARPKWAEQLGPFQVGQPELQTFPIEVWSRLVAKYSRELKVRALQYGDPLGLEELRQAIAVYLRSARGVQCEPQQILIVSGSQQALDLSTRVLLDRGAAAWVEEPGYWLIHQVLQAAECRIVPVPVDSSGLDVAAGVRLSRNARAAFVAPSHQYPLGVTMSASRRVQLLEWAQRTDAWIIEDDYDSEYRYDASPISSLHGLDSNARVIYTSSFSKVLFPSLRVGYMVVPADLVERFVAVRQTMDLCPAYLTQAVLAAFFREGHFSRHIRRMRKLYEERRQVLVDSIQRELGNECTIVGSSAGMHLTILLHDRRNDQQIASHCADHGLLVSPLSASCINEPARQGLVLGFGNSTARVIPSAVRLLKRILRA